MALPARLVPAAAVTLTLALAAPAAANFDELPGEPFDAASNTPYASAATVTKVSPIFDTATDGEGNTPFGEDSGEINQPFKFLGCGAWGSKTAWVRFASRVSGRTNVSIDSSIPGPAGHDVFFGMYWAPTVSPDYSLVSDRVKSNPNESVCDNEMEGGPDESAGLFELYVPPGQTRIFYVQVLSVCLNSPDPPPCDATQRANAVGGPTRVTMTFSPYDTDSDGVADSLDACPTQRNPCAVDADGDGFFKNALPGAQEDCNDADGSVNPGTRERRGNRKDDDCKDGALPYLRVTNRVIATFAGSKRPRRANRFTKLFVRDVPKGLRAVVECRGTGCPGPREYVAKKSRRRMNIRGRLGRSRTNLRPGARVTIKLLRKDRVGRVLVYRFRKKGAPTRAVRCTLPGSRVVRKLSRCAPQGADAASAR